ncbi:uncharacterized protein LOC128303049 [Anopheles moucheti]|uniref:uncharacterized protein LOC128303049 n=1 Tax=Anopheles moucheti TaxID=186751 RepID=UPI0022F0EEC8|nr:uncharacterized protein LOC128303049 [Anopheles moucheti]
MVDRYNLRLDVTDVQNLPDGLLTQVDCTTVRLGSLKYTPNEKVTISSIGVCIVAPNVCRPANFVRLDLQMREIKKVLTHFSGALNVIFLYTKSSGGAYVRKHLEMDPNSDKLPCFQPELLSNNPTKRIVLLMASISMEAKSTIRNIFRPNLLEEISISDAKQLIRRCCPSRPLNTSNTNNSTAVKRSGSNEGKHDTRETRGILSYPLVGRSTLMKREDYMCLAKDQYLNDVVIDFYLNYLKLEMLQEEERQSVHIFGTYFYDRLSTSDGNDPGLFAARKRHALAARWTRRENIFEKKFIVIPINEQSHWFLAIICFPGLDYPVTMRDETPAPSISAAVTQKQAAKNARQPIQQPCILIFDSLSVTSKSHVLATLRDYLTCEYQAKMPDKRPKRFNEHNMPGHCVNVPQQNNYTDCGLYLLQYVEQFFLDPIRDYHLPIEQLEDWFETITVTKKREDICNLIKTLVEKHNPNVLPLPSIELPTLNGKLIMDFDNEFTSASDTDSKTSKEGEQHQFSSSIVSNETTTKINNTGRTCSKRPLDGNRNSIRTILQQQQASGQPKVPRISSGGSNGGQW